MPRILKVAAAQVGSVHLDSDRKDTLQRLVALLKSAAAHGVQLVVYPETAFTTFFPRHVFPDPAELEKYFESDDEHGDITRNESVKALFDEARKYKIDISIGYAERAADGVGYNTCIYYSAREGRVIAKYRKIHLPGNKEPFTDPNAINQLEKKYFTPGDLGFKAFRVPDLVPDALKKNNHHDEAKGVAAGKGDPIMGMMICNDRRWAEAWRAYGLQGVELVMCGYNTPNWAPDLYGEKSLSAAGAEKEALYHHRLVMEYNSYTNSCFSISAARSGLDEGKFGLIGGSSIVGPDGHTIAEAKSTEDEVVIADIDLARCRPGKETVGFCFSLSFSLHLSIFLRF